MPKELTPEECVGLGVEFSCNRMDNGEYRFRCVDGESGSGYALTKMPGSTGGWQNSHYHKSLVETYIVQAGWIGLAELFEDRSVELKVYKANGSFTTQPGRVHNVYMPAGAVIHTVKHGDCSLKNDWFVSEELDAQTKRLSESEVLRLAARPEH